MSALAWYVYSCVWQQPGCLLIRSATFQQWLRRRCCICTALTTVVADERHAVCCVVWLQGTFIDVLSGLFRAVAMAVEQDESSIVSTFGAAALLDVVVGLQAECDSQGLRMLQRFVEARRVAQLVNVRKCDCAVASRSDSVPAAGPVLPGIIFGT
jgi:hypothetical protein